LKSDGDLPEPYIGLKKASRPDSARKRGEKAFKPNADGTHPPIIWLDPNDPQGAADALMLALYGTKEKVAEVLAEHQKLDPTPEHEVKE
jgi:hypothetical protein